MSEREIFCDECGDCAVEVDQGALGEDLDGIHTACQSCNVDGKIVFTDDADEDGVYTRLSFRKLTEAEESELAALAREESEPKCYCGTTSMVHDLACPMRERDEAELEVDRMFQPTDVSELALLLIKDGWVDVWSAGPGRESRLYDVAGPGLAKCGPKKTSVVEALSTEAQEALEIRATREFIATCSYEERMEYARDFPEAYNRAFPVTHPPVTIRDWED